MGILHCTIKKFFQNAGFRPYCWQGCPRPFHNLVACKWLSKDWFLNSVGRKEITPLQLQTPAVPWSSLSTTIRLLLWPPPSSLLPGSIRENSGGEDFNFKVSKTTLLPKISATSLIRSKVKQKWSDQLQYFSFKQLITHKFISMFSYGPNSQNYLHRWLKKINNYVKYTHQHPLTHH